MNTASTVLLSQMKSSQYVAKLCDDSVFGLKNNTKLVKSWNHAIFWIMLQEALNNCTTYTDAEVETLNGILSFYTHK